MSKKTKTLLTLSALPVIALLLFLSQELLNSYYSRIITLIGIYGIMAVSLTLVNGISGVFSLGHAGFIALGAYTSALLTLSPQQKEMTFLIEKLIWPLNSIQIPFFWATIIAGLVAALFAFFIGWPSLRLTGDYFAIATLGFSEIIRILALNLNSITNGALGLKALPDYSNVWWAWGWLLVTVACVMSLSYSSFGRALRAIREDRVAAQAMGINVFKHQLMAFVVGGFFAGISGSLYGHWLSTIDPRTNTFGILLTFNVLIMIVLGGLGSITGAIIGGALFAFLSEWLRFLEGPMNLFGFKIMGMSGMRMLVFSGLFVIIMIFWPRGIMGRSEFSWEGLVSLFRRGEKK
ncbi:branched-chain amino acid ABC transporter permease [Mesotoga sp. B105.6.4]|uniref:branched-chain amino acid ABC transporter permease n=1 Tax=Mesotoga sp. B105.6.4 TaxID=1582224 RepID=UPI000CCC3502|nr:branched-chain amino acid ABC transporter permease [Mesotoga sp. B105.6.4]PNS35873.1 ABC transporter permease [Mesotoga sp. B105.6.4]